MSFSIDNFVSYALSSPKVIIFWDTCSLLDIIRIPFRDEIRVETLSSSIKILEKIKNGQIISVVTHIVNKEYNNNESEVLEEVKRNLHKTHKNLLKVKSLVDSFPALLNFNRLDLISLQLETSLADISKQILNNCLIIEQDSECTNKASVRVEDCIAPGSKGKSEFKDCSIIEHYLKICKNLRDNSFSEKIVFITSNVKDYGSPPDEIKEPLKSEFDTVNLDFYSNITWAESQIPIP